MSKNTVDEVKSRLNITDIVGDYLKLERAGTNFKAKCPFHNEKTPSFFISPDRGTYYCFGCGEKGDVISFVQKFEGLDFIGAMKILAERAGVKFELKSINPNKKIFQEKLYKAHELANKFFQENLKENEKALTYLTDRGLTEEAIKSWQIGFALPEWRSLKTELNNLGLEDKILLQAGLLKQKGDKVYDTFRGRITFPLNDSAGRVVAFSGRIFPNKDDEAKYLNSPETEIFKKSSLLYGFDKAKLAMRKYDFAILVEGQMDLILSHQAGFKNTVATSGTAITTNHLQIIKRLTDNLLIAYDRDNAGVMASKKAYILAIQMGFTVKTINLNDGSDPADLIKESPEKWKELIKHSISVPELILKSLEKETNKEKLLRKLRNELWPIISAILSESEKHRLISNLKLPVLTGIREDYLIDEIKNTKPIIEDGVEDPQYQNHQNNQKDQFPLSKSVKLLLGILLFKKTDQKKLDKIENLVGDEFATMKNNLENSKEKVLFEIEEFLDGNDLEKALADLWKISTDQILKNNLNKKMSKLAKFKEDSKEHKKLLAECREISKKLESN